MSAEEHISRGTYRPDRHGSETPPRNTYRPMDRRRTLAGLPRESRRIVIALLKDFSRWDVARLQTLRAYALSCARLATLEKDADTRLLHREIRANLALLKSLDLHRET